MGSNRLVGGGTTTTLTITRSTEEEGELILLHGVKVSLPHLRQRVMLPAAVYERLDTVSTKLNTESEYWEM
jgi:hypothetical protein